MKTLYFAYGSNLDDAQMQERLPGARAVGVACLGDHGIAFHKPGRDGTGKANLVVEAGAEVWGALYELETEDLDALDVFEGGYARVEVAVRTGEGVTHRAVTYRAERTDPRLASSPGYATRVLRGARGHGLPAGYVAILEATLEASRSCAP